MFEVTEMPVTRRQARGNTNRTPHPPHPNNDLPSEVLAAVLSRLSWPDLLSARMVCTRWREVACLVPVWKNRTLVVSNDNNRCIGPLSIKSIRLTKLSAGVRPQNKIGQLTYQKYKKRLFSEVWNHAGLEKLRLDGFSLDELTDELFGSSSKTLKELYFHETWLSEDQFEQLMIKLIDGTFKVKKLVMIEELLLPFSDTFLSAVENVETLEILPLLSPSLLEHLREREEEQLEENEDDAEIFYREQERNRLLNLPNTKIVFHHGYSGDLDYNITDISDISE